MERWNSRNAFPGLIKDLIGVIIVMRFRRGMAEEKGDEEEAAREEGENEKVRGRSWTIDLASWLLYKCYADLQSRNVIILVDVSSIRLVRNFEKYL